jgi:enoyl-CoA hydratase
MDIMDYKTIEYRKDDLTAIVSINCPPANAFTEELVEDLNVVLDQLLFDGSTRSVLITSLNHKIFLSGGDINLTSGYLAKGDVKSEISYVRGIQRIVEKIARMPKPTIASINGHTIGGGFELAMACDFRLMSDDKTIKLGIPEIDLGFTPGVGGLYRISRKFGQHLALKLGLGFRITVHEAYDLGLADKLYQPDELLFESLEFARKMAKLPTKAVGLVKKIIIEGFDKQIEDVYNLELSCLEEALITEDLKEGINAFLEKRTPNFTGK